jgi:hypothetical protein
MARRLDLSREQSAMRWIAAAILKEEFRKWTRLHRKPLFWWRDDDLRSPTLALDRLLNARRGLPIVLAIIPDSDLLSLSRRLGSEVNVSVSLHGTDHHNRAVAGDPPCEYLPDATSDDIAEVIGTRLKAMRTVGLTPAFFTPPWNRIDERLSHALSSLRCPAISASHASSKTPQFLRIDSHIDVLRWDHPPKFKGHARVVRSLTRALRDRRKRCAFDEPIGFLTHHLDHDEATWLFISWFLDNTHDEIRWFNPGEMFSWSESIFSPIAPTTAPAS